MWNYRKCSSLMPHFCIVADIWRKLRLAMVPTGHCTSYSGELTYFHPCLWNFLPSLSLRSKNTMVSGNWKQRVIFGRISLCFLQSHAIWLEFGAFQLSVAFRTSLSMGVRLSSYGKLWITCRRKAHFILYSFECIFVYVKCDIY